MAIPPVKARGDRTCEKIFFLFGIMVVISELQGDLSIYDVENTHIRSG